MPKEAKIEFEEFVKENTIVVPTSYSEEDVASLRDYKDGQIKALSSLMASLLHITGETMGGGNKAKDRCMECGPRNAHPGCSCVCHECRAYLTEISK